jgi:uncharacterized Zn finger protein (UPF0148 family)
MKFCPTCGVKLQTGNPKFCTECGTNLQLPTAPTGKTEEAVPTQPTRISPSGHEDVETRKLSAYELGLRLEAMAADIFGNMGYTTEKRKKVPTRTGSVCEFDVYLERGTRRMAIECKSYDLSRSVGVSDLHVFKDKLNESGIYSGVFITNTIFSEDAEKLATSTDANIDLWDGDLLREKYFAYVLGRPGTGVDQHAVLPLTADFATASHLSLRNRHAVRLFSPVLLYHPYVLVSYRLRARRKDPSGKPHSFSDSGTYFVDAMDGDIINRDTGVMESIGGIFKKKEERLQSREDKMVADDLKNIPPVTKAILSTSDYRVAVEKPSMTNEDAGETVRDYVIKKNKRVVSYQVKVKGELVTRSFQFVPGANEVTIHITRLVHVPKWDLNFEAGRSSFSRRILASSNRTLVDGLAKCSMCTILKKSSVVVCEECGRPLCEKHSYLEGRWLCRDHISNALREQVKSTGLFSRLKTGLSH